VRNAALQRSISVRSNFRNSVKWQSAVKKIIAVVPTWYEDTQCTINIHDLSR
jgi:hypothetical protein